MSSPRTSRAPKLRRLVPLLVLCAVVVGFGFRGLASYSVGAGAPSRPAPRLAETSAAPELLAFFHPRCPCSRASIAELERVLERAVRVVRVRAFVLDDPEAGLVAHDSPNWNRLAAVHGVQLTADPMGHAARAHGAATSGAVLLSGTSGDLLFDGGVTGARGHVGPNSAADALLARIESDTGPLAVAPVFGCALHASAAAQEKTP